MPPRRLCKYFHNIYSLSVVFIVIESCYRSAFFFFSNEKRPEVQAEHPDWKVGQIAQELGKYWKNLPDEEKHIYEKKAADDKARYDDVSSYNNIAKE